LFSPKQQATENHSNDPEMTDAERRAVENVITEGTVVIGDVISPGDVRVDGTVQGEVRGMCVWIGVDASVEGVVVAERVTIEGSMSGPIFAEHVHLGASSHVQGDLCADDITIRKGAILVGRVWPRQPPSRADARFPKLSGASLPPIALSLSGLKTLEPLSIEKSPPADRVGQKDP
jgi:cytoskeletal protein CcmA (bactofilin family)